MARDANRKLVLPLQHRDGGDGLGPDHPREATGAATGIVGAAGGLGGFFPPLVMVVVKDATGEFVLGFVFLVAFACVYAGLVVPLVKAHVAAVADGG